VAESVAFDHICAKIESGTPLDRLAVRGTVRIALKQAGLDARSVTPDQMAVVVERILPGELTARGVDDVEDLCTGILSGLSSLKTDGGAETPDAVFQRLAGS
jgi:hypothetical protein